MRGSMGNFRELLKRPMIRDTFILTYYPNGADPIIERIEGIDKTYSRKFSLWTQNPNMTITVERAKSGENNG